MAECEITSVVVTPPVTEVRETRVTLSLTPQEAQSLRNVLGGMQLPEESDVRNIYVALSWNGETRNLGGANFDDGDGVRLRPVRPVGSEYVTI